MQPLRDTPSITLYRNGLANLNGEATRTLAAWLATSLLLLPPTRTEPRWLLLPAAEGVTGELPLHGRSDRGHLRFRAPALAIALFAALPDEQPVLRLACQAVGRSGWRLVPCCAESAQQNLEHNSLAA